MIVRPTADSNWIQSCVRWSLDRKVCNTLNVLCLPKLRDAELNHLVAEAIAEAAKARGESGLVHLVGDEPELMTALENASVRVERSTESDLATEWEWESNPELCIVSVETISDAVELFNCYAPHFIVSLLSNDDQEHGEVWQKCNAPFVGNGFTRWVDGQFALDKPELGLSNWQFGRMLGRSGVLSGDSVYSVRLRARQSDEKLHR
jgi:glutamate-5-semialdehyde dehydrogenase